MKIPNWLLYLTNNGSKSRHEKEWDVVFWLGMTLTLLIGVPLLIKDGEYGFAVISILWYLEAFDALRHNRE